MNPQERKAAIAEAREQMVDAQRRSRNEGWTWELRDQFLRATDRLRRLRDPWSDSHLTQQLPN